MEQRPFMIQTIDTAFKYNKVGLASAMAIILLVWLWLLSCLFKNGNEWKEVRNETESLDREGPSICDFWWQEPLWPFFQS